VPLRHSGVVLFTWIPLYSTSFVLEEMSYSFLWMLLYFILLKIMY
jgi:hypothetical protein